MFTVWHLFVYPASNAYNSYFDKDKGSIGGLKHPPKVSVFLYYTSLVLEFTVILLSSIIGLNLVLAVFFYGLISKAYSHPVIRLKKYPFLSWFIVTVFQGYFVFVANTWIWSEEVLITEWRIQLPAVASSLFLMSNYPLTQIYQHQEDKLRGDNTISITLGIIGTFRFSALFFLLGTLVLWYFFISIDKPVMGLLFQIATFPVVVYFLRWFSSVKRNLELADFHHTMTMIKLSSLCLSIFFLVWWIYC